MRRVVQRLRAAGAVIVAKTNMTEFAFSGIGANPHFGTPGNPRDRKRVPGGSSSGAPVAVADGMCEIAIGTDTGGSIRVPAALCGLVGFKPSRQRVPTDGAFPLCKTLDSIGPIAKTRRRLRQSRRGDGRRGVCAARAGRACRPALRRRGRAAAGTPGRHRRRGVFPRRSTRLEKRRRAASSDESCRCSTTWTAVNAKGGISPAEACAVHRDRHGAARRRHRSERARCASSAARRGAADYIDMVRERAALIRAMDARLRRSTSLVMPTTPIVAPTIAEVADPDVFAARTRCCCATPRSSISSISAPSRCRCRATAACRSALMLVARNGHDRRLFRIAAAVVRALAACTSGNPLVRFSRCESC